MMTEQIHRLTEEMDALSRALHTEGEPAIAEKAASLGEKVREATFYVALCGHFSAGKSSLINALCGAALLPSSPIPTSANIVSIRNGATSEAVLTYRDGRTDRVPLSEVSKHAKDGEGVRTVELRHPIPLLGDRGALLDTPGVDSTDPLHAQATEAALHLADVVLYVMDYNHVLSEMNMEFAKRLSEMGKPLVLVVNQIDKHREEEVPFAAFREGVEDAFRSWGVAPAATLYTSMRSPNHPHNESKRLRALLAALVAQGRELSEHGAATAALELVEEALRARAARSEERRAELERLASSEDADAAARYEALLETIRSRDEVRDRLIERIRSEAASIAENANITPATTRDAAHSFLESRQAGFRVGFLFAASKTEEERKRRLDAFHGEFAEHVTARLVWHVRDAVKKAGLSLGVGDDVAQAAAERVRADVTPEWLVAKVRPGAVVSGEYTLNYAKEIAADVRQAVKRSAVEAAESLADAAEALYATERERLAAEAASLEAKLAHRRELSAMEAAEREAKERLLSLLTTATTLAREPIPFPGEAAISAMEARLGDETVAVVGGGLARSGGSGGFGGSGERLSGESGGAARTSGAGVGLGDAAGAFGRELGGEARSGVLSKPAEERDGERRSDLRERFAAAASILEEASELASSLPPLEPAAKALRDKARRLREQRFTAALFGAFSAGKSSFANALLGEAALPVSPNPTTAAINTVVPPTDEWPHGTARVTMKTREAALEGVRHSLEALGMKGNGGELTPEEALKRIASIAKASADVPPGGKAHLAFLKAVAAGWAEAEPVLGTFVRADREQFRAYVAEERKSAFVERIELFYDSSLARQGVTLVDTPGADSINARHTGVAFNYMKNADAIFFVTYYNHAFSRADRQFLEQLGRVKDAFELDKMFFVVNAADLAESEAELQDVLEHVRTNLAAFGVRRPRLFPVSSLRALSAKQANDPAEAAASGIAAFETQFARFAGEELAALAVRSAEAELKRTESMLQRLLAGAQSGERERREALAKLEESEANARATLRRLDLESVASDVRKETAEQLYYVKQRFQHRFGEWFAASFNPSSLREDRGNVKQSLAWAWRDLTAYLQTELVNETLAVALRLERYINRSVAAAVERWNAAVQREAEAYEPDPWEELAIATPDIESVWAGEEPDPKLLSAHYKSAKAFFEGDGRKALRDALLARWQPVVTAALDEAEAKIAAWAEQALVQAREQAVSRIDRALAESMSNTRASWEEPLDQASLVLALDRMRALSDAFGQTSRVRQ